MARITTRSGPMISLFPLAVGTMGACRMCRENEEVMGSAIRALHEDRSSQALDIAGEWAQQMEGHSCQKWIDTGFMAPRRGRWLSTRLEIGIWDPVLQTDLRIPIARADLLALPDDWDGIPTGFHVVSTPGSDEEGRTAQWFLGNLDKDERQALLADLKEV